MPAEYVAWINGESVPLSAARLSIFDAGVTGGVIVSERLRTFRHAPFLLEEHIDRLAASAETAFVPLRMPPDELTGLIRDVVRRNAEHLPAEADLAVSVFATPGTGIEPTLCVYATEIPAEHYVADYNGVALATPATRAIPAEALSPQIKTRSRLHWHIADTEAARQGGAKALLIDAAGHLAETATGNLFLYDGTTLLTPRRAGTLHGISQQYVMELAGKLGIPCQEADLKPDDLANAREAILSSSIYCALPVTQFNGTKIDDGRPGAVFVRLLDAWSNAVGVDIVEQMKWMAHGERGA